MAQAPESAAYGLMALAPLGPGMTPAALAAGLLTAVLANPLVALVGGGGLVTAPRAALSILTAALVSRLLETGGPGMTVTTVLALLAAGLVLAGLLQCLFGLLRLGTVVKFTPHPVRVGLSSGVGLLLLASALPVVLGQPFGGSWGSALQQPLWGALAVAATTLLAWLLAVRWASPLPAGLVAMGAGMAAQALAVAGGLHNGLMAGVPALDWPWSLQGQTAQVLATLRGLHWFTVSEVLLFSVTLAVLGLLDTLLAASVVDGLLRQSRDPNRELSAQGLSHALMGLVGGLPHSPSVARSVSLVQVWRAPRAALMSYGLVTAVLLLAVPQLLGWLPLAAIGGLLLLHGAKMVDPWLWRTARVLWLQRGPGYSPAQRRLLIDNLSVALAVALASVLMGLAAAVLLGAAISVLLFVRANMRDVVRRLYLGGERRSLKVRTPQSAALLQREGHRIAVLELQGALFFGTADSLRHQLEGLPPEVDTAVLDLSLVNEVDATGARILLETASDWSGHGRVLCAAGWPTGDVRRGVVEAIARAGHLAPLEFLADVDRALEAAEGRLLARFGLGTQALETLQLAETALAQGLAVADVARLAQHMSPLHLAAGEHLFRSGDAADGLYVGLSGHIGIWLPGGQRRLASFAPGVTVGELAVLERGTRSADAVAETDVHALHLSTAALDALQQQHPLLAAQLIRNVALHLAGRLRGLTVELSALLAHSAPVQAAVEATPSSAEPSVMASLVASESPDLPAPKGS